MKFLYYVIIFMALHSPTGGHAQPTVTPTPSSVMVIKLNSDISKNISQNSEKPSTIKTVYDNTLGTVVNKTISAANKAVGFVVMVVVMGIITFDNMKQSRNKY